MLITCTWTGRRAGKVWADKLQYQENQSVGACREVKNCIIRGRRTCCYSIMILKLRMYSEWNAKKSQVIDMILEFKRGAILPAG